MSEEAAVGTAVGVIMAAAVNQTIIYSIIEGNEGGELVLPWARPSCSQSGACYRVKFLHAQLLGPHNRQLVIHDLKMYDFPVFQRSNFTLSHQTRAE